MTSLPVRPRSESAPSALPSKLFFRIGEVASLVGVEPHVLRYWEREFRSIRPTKSAKGQRVYSRKDVENLLRVRDLLYRDGFTIAGAKKRLQRGGLEPGSVATALQRADVEAEGETAASGETAHALFQHSEAELESEADDENETENEAADTDSDVDVDSESESESGRSSEDELEHGEPLRIKLTALRAEVEAFLGELETDGASMVRTAKRSETA